MPSCLGLYIESNLIKYAKISKEHDNIRIESFGMKFYDNIDETIKQIISETYSYKTPISVNISDERYTNAQLFSLLSKKDLEKAVETEFEFYCSEVGKNRNALEYRKLLVPNLEDKDKINGLYVYVDKSSIVGRLQLLDAYKINNIIPVPLSIMNLNNTFAEKKNSIVINIEKNTSVTTIVNGQIQKVDIIESGMREILDNIIVKENSYAKAYEICKNSTIYTTQGRNLQVEENEYLEDIMPILYNIIEKVKDIIITNQIEISNVYITGLATSINNIDLYFQENFPDKNCEILTPFFINKTNIKVNVKDYIEVNSAISLALQGVGIGTKEINFKHTSAFEKISKQINNVDSNSSNKKEKKKNSNSENEKERRSNIIGGSLDLIDKIMIRTATSILLLLIIYVVFAKIIAGQIGDKQKDINSYINDANQKIESVTKYTSAINSKTRYYENLILKMDEASKKTTQSYARKNVIPNLLRNIENIVPKGVQILSIKNPTLKNIKIEAQATEYEQLGFFISKIKLDGVLLNVKSTESVKQNEYIKITIEGNLPY